ncbi:MAG: protein BatD [Candidatus Hydrogenedentes bacterium]|nr:protein BatD [Candidatus Hydrogenedentota bacterium]
MICKIRYIAPLLLIAAQVYAQGRVTTTVSTKRAAVNEMFYITIEAEGGNIQEPDMSPIQEIGLQLGTPSTGSQTRIQMINGQTTTMQSRSWRYPASSAQEGTFELPRIPVTIDGQQFFSQAATIEITHSLDLGNQSPQEQQSITVDDLAFVRMFTDKTELYPGEALLLTMQVLYQQLGNVAVEGNPPFPETEGFYPGAEWRNNTAEVVNGSRYQVTEFVRILYPTLSGNFQIEAWDWQGAVRWYDQRGRMKRVARIFHADAIPITVRSLPQPPEDFSGAVGNYKIQAQLADQELTQGIPVRLTLTLSGQGNPNVLSAPVLPKTAWAHFSEAETTLHSKENDPEVVKEFSYLITPLEVGEHELPSLNFVYFSPETKRYEQAETKAFTVSVHPAEGTGGLIAVGGTAENKRNQIEVFDDDILPIITDSSVLTQPLPRLSPRLPLRLYFGPLPLLFLFALLLALLRWRGRLAADHGYARRFFAGKRFEKTLSGVLTKSDAVDILERALRGYIADVFNINDAGLTSSEVELLLMERHVDEETTNMAVRFLRACERTKYAGRNSAADEVEALHAAARKTVERLQTQIREKRS